MARDKGGGAAAKQGPMDKFTEPTGVAEAVGGSPSGSMPDNAALMAAITQSRDMLDAKIGAVGADVTLLRQDLRNAVARITETESRISEVEDDVSQLKRRMAHMESVQKTLALKVEDAEGRARRNNLRFVGFPEDCEHGNMERFITTWLESWLPPDAMSRCFVVERAHRALQQKPPPGSRPRPVIAKFLNYLDRDTVLKQARTKEQLLYQNSRIMIFPDYTRLVQQRRQSFTAAKAKLRELQISYALLFPARLRVVYRSKTLFFDTPEAVFQWTDETVRVKPHTPPRRGSDTSSSGVPRENARTQKRRPKKRRSRSQGRSHSCGPGPQVGPALGSQASDHGTTEPP